MNGKRGRRLMKKLFFVLCFLMALVSLAHPAEFKKCVDQNGNTFLTNNPPRGVKCESTGIEITPSGPVEREALPDAGGSRIRENENEQVNPAYAEERLRMRVRNCSSCCAGKKEIFLNINQDSRLAEALLDECIACCKSEGKTSSEWSDCWAQSDK